MSNQDFPRGAAGSVRAHEGASEWTTKAAKDALSRASAFAEDAGGKVKQAASDTAATLTGEVKEILNRQVGGGADMLGNVARSVRRAAEDIERDSPQIADLARTLADHQGLHTAAAGGGFRVGSTRGLFCATNSEEQPVSASTADSALSLLSPGRRWYLLWRMSG